MDNITEYITLFTFCATMLGVFFGIKQYQIDKRNETPTFRIVQNLWSENPKYELVNEANSKLDQIPRPGYIMLIPSKVYFHFKNGQSMSVMVLTPVSYDVITEQVYNAVSTGIISVTNLPKNFYGKKGERDVITSRITCDNPNMKISIETYPFLVIVSKITYKFKKKLYSKILISTPLCNEELDKEEYNNLLDYIADNHKQEIKLPQNGISIYKAVNKKVVYIFENQKNRSDFHQFFGGKQGGYGFILKKISQIVSPVDIMREHTNK